MKFARDIIAATIVSSFCLACSSHAKFEPEQAATEYLEGKYVFDVNEFSVTTEKDQSYYYVVFYLKQGSDRPDRSHAAPNVDSYSGANVVVMVEKPSNRVIGATLRDMALKRRELPQT